MKRIMLLLIMLSSLQLVHAQQKLKFRSLNTVGLLIGSSERAGELHTVNGITRNNWFAGIGLGWDNYRISSFPLYASFAREWRLVKNALFVGADGGANFSEYRPGWFARGGVGYKIGVGKTGSAVLFDIGHSFKQVIQPRKDVQPCVIGPCPENIDIYNYKLSRISLRMGLQF